MVKRHDPVAGALPLCARPFSPGSAGDSEQEYHPIFGEEDSNKDGVLDRATGIASWLEVFALGGIAPKDDRRDRSRNLLGLRDSPVLDPRGLSSRARAFESRRRSRRRIDLCRQALEWQQIRLELSQAIKALRDKTGDQAACNALLAKRTQWVKEHLYSETMPVPYIMYQDFRYRRYYEP